MNFITFVTYVTLVLTAIVFGLMVVIAVLNLASERRVAVNGSLRSRMLPILQHYLAGNASVEAVLNELKRDREMALECLVETASGLPLAERPRLHPFLEPFQFERRMMDEVKSRNWSKCIRAATHLGFTGNRECVPALLQALEDEMLDVRIAAARALAQLGVGEAVEPILRSLALPGMLPQQNTAEILCEMKEAAVEPLLRFLRENGQEEEGSALAVALRVLGLLKVDKATPEIMQLLKHPDSEVRLNGARTLGLIGAQTALAGLCQVALDPVWQVRSSAVQALGCIKDAMAIHPLTVALGDPAWWVRFNAAQALYELGGEGIEVLKKAMVGNPDAFARDVSRQILEERGVIAAEGGTKP